MQSQKRTFQLLQVVLHTTAELYTARHIRTQRDVLPLPSSADEETPRAQTPHLHLVDVTSSFLNRVQPNTLDDDVWTESRTMERRRTPTEARAIQQDRTSAYLPPFTAGCHLRVRGVCVLSVSVSTKLCVSECQYGR